MNFIRNFWTTKSRLQKVVIIGSFVFLFCIGIGVGYALYLLDKTEDMVDGSYQEIDREEDTSSLRPDPVSPVSDNVSVLFIGVDTGEERGFGEQSRSDALLYATFNVEKNTVKLLSIPRDTYTYIPVIDGFSKITHAHFYGGAKGSIETVEKFLNVPVDYYVRLNFDAFVEVVDALDGIQFDVPYELYEMDSHDNEDAIHLLPGEQLITGEEALALARTRKYDNDFERGKRQQAILKAIFNKSTSVASVFKLGAVLDAIGPNMSTNLTFDKMKGFLSYVTDENVSIQSIELEGDGGYMDDGGWYFQVDEESKEQVSQKLREHLDIPTNYQFTSELTNEYGIYLMQ
ncbi:LCP family protein [Ornithinibacillus xuwenensis]|uniref:LCP family protein n=1 Tax=Ornithinibacillus xuwenensis TaxID=3144668 RepID=A0ABU9XGI7_9BACI